MNFPTLFRKIQNFDNYRLQFRATFVFLTTIVSMACGQVFNMNNMPPPKTSMEFSQGSLDENAKVIVDITVPDNWHVNANIAADEFLKPSSIEIAARGITFGEPVWPEAIKEYNEALDLENLVFRGNFQITIPVSKVEDGYDSLTTNAIFHYQACDNSICLAPSQVEIRLDKISGSSLKKNGNSQVVEAVGPGDDITGSPNESAGIASLLFFALIGGIILNLMPCVLPVLSLKLFGLINQAGESRQRLIALGCATTSGILASFWILAAIVSAVKAAGGNAGWGMQFQSAGFIAFMVVILTAFAMSFFGVFEIWLPGSATTKMDEAGRKQGVVGAFFTGALLVLLSTPCSAPFLGTAMGFAFTASIPVLFLFFTAAGVGLASPYLLVSFCPALLKVFPKPGPWMVKLQKLMGILLLATVAWLLWVVHEQADTAGVILFTIIAAISILGSFAIGKIAPPGVPFIREAGSIVAAAVVLFGIWFAVISPKYENILMERFEARASEQTLENGWLRYSPELVEVYAKQGKTIFIDVTADWCITCKANEAAVLSGAKFLQAMDSAGVIRMKADWTRETPEVNALLRSMGKSGVPAYAIYPQGDISRQHVFPELLTTDAILEKVR